MFLKQSETEDKYDKLVELSNEELLDRIRSFPDQDLLNNEMNGNPRKLQVGRVAEQQEAKTLTEGTRRNLSKAFASITSIAVTTEDKPKMPDNVQGFDLWNYYKGDFEGKNITFGLTEEEPGKIAIYAPTEDLTTEKIGYLNESFTSRYPIHGNHMAAGQWYHGKVEIILDMEQIYGESCLKSSLTENGTYVYERPFIIPNIQYEFSDWGDHEANSLASNIFEENMNAFPMKEMIGDMLEKNGSKNPITDIRWSVFDADDCKIQITADEPLDSSQLLNITKILEYLTVESSYEKNPSNHRFEQYMDRDTDFLKAVQDSFETKMAPSIDHLFRWGEPLTEVKTESNILLTDKDLANIEETDTINL